MWPKWSDSGSILKAEPTAFASGLDSGGKDLVFSALGKTWNSSWTGDNAKAVGDKSSLPCL